MLKSIALSALLVACATPTQEPLGLVSAKAQAIESCGELCLSNDVSHTTLPRIVSYNYDETLDLVFDSAAGSALIYFDSWGNSGGRGDAPIQPDGLQVAVGDGEMCLSEDKYDGPNSDPNHGQESICSNVVTTVDGENHVPIHLHVWNGLDGWSADTMDITITLQ